eukprot:347063-Amphidinium_carterae.1
MQDVCTATDATRRWTFTAASCAGPTVPACLEGLEILICAMHGRITPGPGSWNPAGGWNHPGALREASDRGLAM